jgi:hypothetical protein
MVFVLSENDSMERLLELSEFRDLASEVEDYILGIRVRAYHCTKELEPGLFQKHGLRLLQMKEHIEEFLENVVSHHKPELLGRFRSAYEWWQQSGQLQGREGKIAFCMSPYLVKDSGTSLFFEYYGGEALCRPFMADKGDECLDFLRELGKPVVVEAEVPAVEFETFRELNKFPYAQDILSHYVKRLNSEFKAYSLQAYLERPVLPSEIVAVHEKDTFWNENWSDLEKTDE